MRLTLPMQRAIVDADNRNDLVSYLPASVARPTAEALERRGLARPTVWRAVGGAGWILTTAGHDLRTKLRKAARMVV